MQRILLLVLIFTLTVTALFAQCISGDCKNGNGIYLYPSGARYVGAFKNGEIHGLGACYYTDGSFYRGHWKNRYPDGEGTRTYADGIKRTGLWKKGQAIDENGNILEKWTAKDDTNKDGTNIQSGCILGDCKNGEGVFAYADGSKYEGQFQNGQINGFGTFTYLNGDKYVGHFQDGYSHGEGTFYHADGVVTDGVWENGEFVGDGSLNGREGCIEGDCQDGFGTYIFRNGEATYTGKFQGSLPHGKGEVHYANGEHYKGQWANGSFNGLGILTLSDGAKVQGFWENGTFMGIDIPDTPNTNQVIPSSPMTTANPTPAPLPDTKIWAVIIGIAAYNHMPALRYTDDDAYRIYAFLKSPEGGALKDEQIKILIDEAATKESITLTMQEVFGQAGPNDLIMIYFSGHGLKGSFLPSDFDGFNNKLMHEEINNILKKSPAKYKLCIADACHSGSLLEVRSATMQSLLKSYYETLAQAQAGTALIMSSKSDETSLESNKLRQGVFSHFLIRGLKGEADSNQNKVVSVQELYNYIAENVRIYTNNRQSPVIQGDYDANMTVSVVR